MLSSVPSELNGTNFFYLFCESTFVKIIVSFEYELKRDCKTIAVVIHVKIFFLHRSSTATRVFRKFRVIFNENLLQPVKVVMYFCKKKFTFLQEKPCWTWVIFMICFQFKLLIIGYVNKILKIISAMMKIFLYMKSFSERFPNQADLHISPKRDFSISWANRVICKQTLIWSL